MLNELRDMQHLFALLMAIRSAQSPFLRVGNDFGASPSPPHRRQASTPQVSVNIDGLGGPKRTELAPGHLQILASVTLWEQ